MRCMRESVYEYFEKIIQKNGALAGHCPAFGAV